MIILISCSTERGFKFETLIMAGSGPKILLAKPPTLVNRSSGGGGPNAAAGGGGEDDSAAAIRSRQPSVGSLNLLSDSWEFNGDRFLPFLTDNTDFTVVGIIGPAGAGKSTIMNEIYGFDASSAGMLPPFLTQSEEMRAMAKHCTIGIEPRISSERIILLDTQAVFSPSVLAEMIRPDGSSTVSVLNGESQSLSAELAYEMMSIQLGVLLTSICNVILVVSEGVHGLAMWRLMSTVDLLNHGIPDPSSVSTSHSEKEIRDKIPEPRKDHLATPVFVHTKLREREFSPSNYTQLKLAVNRYFSSTTFKKLEHKEDGADSELLELYLVPSKNANGSCKPCYESHASALCKLRNQVLSMSGSSFPRAVSERDWLKNSAKVWEMIKSSSIIAEYCKTLQSSGMFRR